MAGFNLLEGRNLGVPQILAVRNSSGAGLAAIGRVLGLETGLGAGKVADWLFSGHISINGVMS